MTKYQPKMIDGEPNPLYRPQKNRHPRTGDEGYIPHSGSKSKHKSKFDRAEFIAWDGEGFDIDGTHVYGLLMDSKGNDITNEHGISTLTALDFLTTVAQRYPNAIHVCYGASYDVNMILRDVPREDLETLYKGEKIIYDRYELEYRPRKSFVIRRMPAKRSEQWREKKRKDGTINYEKVYEAKMTLWDVLGFFQGTFVSALEKYGIVAPIGDIQAGKQRRGRFTPEELEHFIKPYCRKEVDALVVLMEKLHSNLVQAGLKITRWDGAGACASALLQREGIKHAMKECPPPVQQAALHAYAGGRIEPLQYGHYEGKVYHYDINSAYPFAMLHLPSLCGGRWEHVTSFPAYLSTFTLLKVSWAFPESCPLYPFPYRTTSGSILFPPHGKNWVWFPEYSAAYMHIPDFERYCHVEEAWCFSPASDEKPFAFLRDLFEMRKKWKQEGNGAEKAMKLAINSVYGKMVQQLGYMREDGAGNIIGKPPYHQIEWGGYVTSYTRAMLYEACMQKPSAIISLATDGIYSAEPLDLPTGTELGEWDYHVHDDITLVSSGIYWYTDAGKEHAFYRGFDKGTLERKYVLSSWERDENIYQGEEWKDFDGNTYTDPKSTRFITLGAALLPNGGREAQEKRFTEWRTWKTIPRQLHLDMTNVVKRCEITDYDQLGEKPFMWQGPRHWLNRTRARTIRFLRYQSLPFRDSYVIENQEVTLLSAPYKLKWEVGSTYEAESTIEGVPAFEYESQHLDTFV